MVGRADVARAAGVSPAVVSYVLNDSHPVSSQTRAKVEAAIRQLDYRPNALARSLALARTHTLGLLIPDSSNPYFAQLAAAVEQATNEAGLVVLLGNGAGSEQRELAYVRTFLDRKVDGIIAVPEGEFDAGWREISRARVPAVSLDRLPSDLDLPSVVVDNVQGSRLATEHLLAHGRARIACIAGPAQLHTVNDRAAGWASALTDAGYEAPAQHLIHCPFTVEAGHRATLALLEADDTIDGLFIASDMQALGALRALADLSLTPGLDIALVSFDGIQLGEYTTPRLSTVAQPYEQLASEVVRMIVALIEQPSRDRSQMHLKLPATLVPRDTCGCQRDAP